MTPRIRQHRQGLREVLNMIISTQEGLEFLSPIEQENEEGSTHHVCHRGLEKESYGCRGVKVSDHMPPQSVEWLLRGYVDLSSEYSYYSQVRIVMLKTNWYSGDAIQGYYREYLQLDSSENGMLSQSEVLNLRWYSIETCLS